MVSVLHQLAVLDSHDITEANGGPRGGVGSGPLPMDLHDTNPL